MQEIPTNFLYESNSVLVIGSKRCGKTEYVCRYIRLHCAVKVFCYDSEQREFSRRLGVPCAANEEQLASLLQSQRIVCYDPDEEFGKDRASGLDWFLTYAWTAAKYIRGVKLVAVDELQNYMTAQELPEALEDILCRGGRNEIDTVMIGNQPNMLHNVVRNSVTEIVAFRVVDETARKYLKDKNFPEEQLMSLPNCVYFHKDVKDLEPKKFRLVF